MVQVSYAIGGRKVAYMTVRKQDAIPPGQAPYINATLAGVPAVISGNVLVVSYLWVRNGLLIDLQVFLLSQSSECLSCSRLVKRRAAPAQQFASVAGAGAHSPQ
jgi:hypothetical protein